MGPHPRKSGKKVLILCKFNLGTCMRGTGSPGKDVEDKVGPVEDTAAKSILDIPKLAWRELVIKNCNIDIVFRNIGRNFTYFTRTNECPGIRYGKLLKECIYRFS